MRWWQRPPASTARQTLGQADFIAGPMQRTALDGVEARGKTPSDIEFSSSDFCAAAGLSRARPSAGIAGRVNVKTMR
jgi:hypothetical protein